MSQPQKSPHEDFIMTFIVVFLVCGLAFIIWKIFRLQLLEVLRWVRVGELQVGMWLHGNDYVYKGQKLSQWRDWLSQVNVRAIENQHIFVSTRVALDPIRTLIIGALGLMTVFVIIKGPGSHYRRRMGLEALMREQAKSFPNITPFLEFDPRDLPFRAPGAPVPGQLPLFAEALSPEEWMAFHEVSYTGGQLDINRAWAALGLQLGRRWEGAEKLPPHAQGLYAAFCLKAARKRRDCDTLLAELSVSWSAAKGLRIKSKTMAKIKKIIKDPKLGGAMAPFAAQHAYETTAMLRCLQRARAEGGVLAPSEFVWLRGHDRNLWYPLNNLGRKSYMAEAAGAMVHFTNELIAGQKIPTPRFEEVIRGMEAYMKSGANRAMPVRDAEARHKQRFKAKKKKGKR